MKTKTSTSWLLLVALSSMLMFCSTPSSNTTAPTPTSSSALAAKSGAPSAFNGRLPRAAPPVHQETAPMDQAAMALAACASPNGQWRCAGKGVKPTLAAGPQPIFPTAWTVPAWFIDKQNTIGCASDSNSGTSATCTGGCAGSVCTSGIGPLRSFQELNVHRWGCFGNPRACPRLRQDTTITHVSGDTTGTDPEVFYNTLENGSSLFVKGTITVVNSASLAGTVPKNRATPQLLTTNLGFAAGVGTLLVNSTHPSHAWTYKNTAGTTFSISQPLLLPTLPTASFPTEVDTWANLDTVAIDTVTPVNVTDVRPVLIDYNGPFSNGDYLVDLVAFDPTGAGDDNIFIGPHAFSYDVRFDRAPFIVEETGIDSAQIFANCYFDGGFNGGPVDNAIAEDMLFAGGVFTSTAVQFSLTRGTQLDEDLIFDPTFHSFTTGTGLGEVYIESGLSLTLTGGSTFLISINAAAANAPFLWGPGHLSLQRSANLSWDTGFFSATSIFLLTGGISLNGVVGGLCPNGATVVNNFGFAITGPNLDSPCGAGTGYGDQVFLYGRASLTGGI